MSEYGHCILHIASVADWRSAQQRGLYEAASLQSEGFIHCSRAHQVAEVANRLFRGRDDLLILLIDPSLLTHPLRDEAAANGQTYPHVYGPINLHAVVRAEPWPPSPDGSFTFRGPVLDVQ